MKKLIYRTRDICELISLSRSQLHRLITAGTFPAPVPLGGGRAVGFVADDVERWLADRVAAAASAKAHRAEGATAAAP
jgi:prophage regulatory protein